MTSGSSAGVPETICPITGRCLAESGHFVVRTPGTRYAKG
jgi:hypothetical protein